MSPAPRVDGWVARGQRHHKKCRPGSWWPGRKPSDPSGHAWKLLSELSSLSSRC